MELPTNQERIVQMHQMLFEMARGNFKQRIPVRDLDDELETLVVLINMVAEEMGESIFQEGYFSVHQSRGSFSHTTLLIDAAARITDVNVDLGLFLGYETGNLINKSLSHFIAGDSWMAFQNRLQTSSEKRIVLSLVFMDRQRQLYTAPCTVLRLASSGGILLTMITPVFDASYSSEGIEKRVNNSKQRPAPNVFVTQKLYDYILEHLHEPLPPIFMLARTFGTNEYKLKEDFRHFFKMSIYKFYNTERLKRACFLIQTTTLSFKTIAEMNGYINYPNFCKAFRKQYGFSPSTVKRIV